MQEIEPLQVDAGRIQMPQMPPHIVELILSNGPFPRTLVAKWPQEVQDDYLALMELDLQSMGIDEFRRMGRALGEAYLLSLHRPLADDPHLLAAWTAITGSTRPPELPDFRDSSS